MRWKYKSFGYTYIFNYVYNLMMAREFILLKYGHIAQGIQSLGSMQLLKAIIPGLSDCTLYLAGEELFTSAIRTHLLVARESSSSRKMMQPLSASLWWKMSASRRSDSPYHLEATASRGTYTRGTAAWLAITLRMSIRNQSDVKVRVQGGGGEGLGR